MPAISGLRRQSQVDISVYVENYKNIFLKRTKTKKQKKVQEYNKGIYIYGYTNFDT